MNTVSRRTFVRETLAGGALAVSTLSCSAGDTRESVGNQSSCNYSLPLKGSWLFRTDHEGRGERDGWFEKETTMDDWRTIEVPGTWQVIEGLEEYVGKAWYRCTFEAPATGDDSWVRLEFEAVYHSAVVWLNGVRVGEHLRKGYTAFTVDLTGFLNPGRTNLLTVEVDNSFDDKMLPRNRSFDWTMDGGIYRPVNLLVTSRIFVEQIRVDALLQLDTGKAVIETGLSLRNCHDTAKNIEIKYSIKDESSGITVRAAPEETKAVIEGGGTAWINMPESILDSPVLWHFDNPHLYVACVEIRSDNRVVHRTEDIFGVRRLEVREEKFYLNGEPVRLIGAERMAGSNPLFGMAEPSAWIDHDHEDLKRLNCVFTRVHWPQDRRVLDYCDRHGIMIQLEVPTWGPATFNDMKDETDPEIMENGLDQLREMIGRDRNHPSVVVWGLCNEIGGQNPPARQFAETMLREARKLDPHRLCTYASNSLQETPGKDVSSLMDFVEWNEYYESWFPGTVEDMEKNLLAIHEAFPGKPIVISEYGYCQCRPERTEGDRRVVEILKSHTEAFRRYPFVAGAIFFSYNDYRTHIGDKGLGAYKQRVHGVVDLFGARKPSFEELGKESSPLESLKADFSRGILRVRLQTRDSLPSYRLKKYRLRIIVHGYDNLPMESHSMEIEDLVPGEGFSADLPVIEKNPSQIVVELLRPTGFPVRTARWKAGT